jgi:hypothetical protein
MSLYVIVIAEHVTGKSKGPPGYNRAKPLKYPNADVPHPIIYWKKFTAASDDDAMIIAKDAAKEMFKLYSLNLGSGYSKVMEYTLALHNVKTDTPQTIFSTVPDIKSNNGLLYNNIYKTVSYLPEKRHRLMCSNSSLKSWGILTYNQISKSTVSYR